MQHNKNAVIAVLYKINNFEFRLISRRSRMSFLKYFAVLSFVFAIAVAPVYAQKKDKEAVNPWQKDFDKIEKLNKELGGDATLDDKTRKKHEDEIKKLEKKIADESKKKLNDLQKLKKSAESKKVSAERTQDENKQKCSCCDGENFFDFGLEKRIKKLSEEIRKYDEQIEQITKWSKNNPAPPTDIETIPPLTLRVDIKNEPPADEKK